MRIGTVALMAAVLAAARGAAAQGVDGYASVMFDVLPDVEIATAASGLARRTVAELRARLFAERRVDVGEHIRVTAAGFVEGLAAQRAYGVSTALVRPQELHVEFLGRSADLRIGYSRVTWGRLDEFLPTDVVNPLDVARFFLEGRSESRMSVAMVRGRFTPSERFSLDAVYVPVFRRGRFDQLEEDSSPFNLTPLATRIVQEPPHRWSNAQGGLRASVTTGRVDWALSAYRGFEPLPLYDVRFGEGVATVEGHFPRFTMVGGDFETVHGAWGFRGEVAAFVDRTLQLIDQPLTAEGHAFEAGLGADRKAGEYRVSANVVVSGRTTSRSAQVDETDALVVASLDRSFAGETRHLRAFAVYNPGEDSAFARLILSFNLRDNVTLETSGGLFTGAGVDAFSRLTTRDFLYARLKVFF